MTRNCSTLLCVVFQSATHLAAALYGTNNAVAKIGCFRKSLTFCRVSVGFDIFNSTRALHLTDKHFGQKNEKFTLLK